MLHDHAIVQDNPSVIQGEWYNSTGLGA